MNAIVRKNDEAVSPVIATILMVAITVVLAAVLYVMVSGLISTPTTSQQIGVNVGRSGDGSNWILTFTSAPTGLAISTVSLTIKAANGTQILPATTLNKLTSATGTPWAQYVPASATQTSVAAADYILVNMSHFPSGSQAQLATTSGILWGPQALQ